MRFQLGHSAPCLPIKVPNEHPDNADTGLRPKCANSAHSPGPVGRIIGISVKLVGMASRATT